MRRGWDECVDTGKGRKGEKGNCTCVGVVVVQCIAEVIEQTDQIINFVFVAFIRECLRDFAFHILALDEGFGLLGPKLGNEFPQGVLIDLCIVIQKAVLFHHLFPCFVNIRIKKTGS